MVNRRLKLYLDFNGAILNTIDVTHRILKENNITEKEDIFNFCKNLDWNKLLDKCNELNNSNIKKY